MEKKIVTIDKDLEDLVPTYLETRKKELIKLRELFTQNSLAEISAIAHKLAGNAGGYGFQELTDIGRRMEAAGKASEKEKVGIEIENVAKYLDQVEVKFE